MCGRFAFYSSSEAAAALFRAQVVATVDPRYNIAPSENVAAIREPSSGRRELVTLRWGLVPYWAKDPSIGHRLINARAESAAEKPAYREAFRKRRCLVLADGFYEWRPGPGGKIPWFVSLANGEPFAFAGLWERWRDRGTGEALETATIVTTAAQGFIAELHDRMPVVLQREQGDRWLAGDDGLLEEAAEHPPALRAWPVDRKVNGAGNEGAELIEPAGDTVTAKGNPATRR
ncbi:MAG TPA: SOS response-associated peptidase [Woeseiaceae bacterium]|jgi:putative SOS response-associated peptidase YedK|nr:SOS response-associated peptidase [Woeseiaceae bacterium]